MKTIATIELSMQEVKEALVQFYTNLLVDDKKNTEELMRSGNICSLPNFVKMCESQLADHYAELNCLGDTLAEATLIDLIIAKSDCNKDKIYILWQRNDFDVNSDAKFNENGNKNHQA